MTEKIEQAKCPECGKYMRRVNEYGCQWRCVNPNCRVMTVKSEDLEAEKEARTAQKKQDIASQETIAQAEAKSGI